MKHIPMIALAVSMVFLGTAIGAGEKQPAITGLIIQFNGKQADGVEANTKVAAFKPAFEKELIKLAEKIPGKPEIKISHWYTVINGCAIRWTKGNDETLAKTKAALEKLPYVKTVEEDRPVGINNGR